MTLLRFAKCSLPILGAILLMAADPGRAFATEPQQPLQPSAMKRSPHHGRTRAASKESETTRQAQERERREDLERRVERLEQLYEMKPPTMPPAEPTK
jgi:hypothetical protein